MGRREYTVSQCICPQCGHMFPIPRKAGRPREKGHKKRIWCPWCKKIQNMTEIRENDFVEDTEVMSERSE